MRIERRHTTSGRSPYAGIDFRLTTSEIPNPDGSVVFKLENVEVPTEWSQVASDVLAQKYFRKAGVAARLKKVEEESVDLLPVALRARHRGARRSPKKKRFVSELSAKQVFDRLAGCWMPTVRWPRPKCPRPSRTARRSRSRTRRCSRSRRWP